MKRLMVVGAGYGGALIATYDFDGEMDESRVTEILKEIGVIRMNRR